MSRSGDYPEKLRCPNCGGKESAFPLQVTIVDNMWWIEYYCVMSENTDYCGVGFIRTYPIREKIIEINLCKTCRWLQKGMGIGNEHVVNKDTGYGGIGTFEYPTFYCCFEPRKIEKKETDFCGQHSSIGGINNV